MYHSDHLLILFMHFLFNFISFVLILCNVKVVAGFMSQVVGKPIFSNPAQIVLTAGAAPAMEILIFSIADPGNAFLVPSPYCPE